ncbi:MAG TPA: hypothetical protein VFZ17_14160 [Acidimicrobiia bacterium]|nr:hypothetical protein [Acidimicrobiia bacterium]
MSDESTTEKVRRPDPVGTAGATAIGEKLSALRAGNGPGGLGLSRKEMRKLVKQADGVSMMNQAPRLSADSVGPLEHMLRMVPTTRRHKEPRIKVGDPVVDFSLLGSHGETVSLDSLRGSRPFAIRLTRAVGSGVI